MNNALTVLRRENFESRLNTDEFDFDKFELQVREETRSLLRRECQMDNVEITPELVDEAKSVLGYMIPSRNIGLNNNLRDFKELLQENCIHYFNSDSVLDYQIDWKIKNISLWRRFLTSKCWYIGPVMAVIFNFISFFIPYYGISGLVFVLSACCFIIMPLMRWGLCKGSRTKIKNGNMIDVTRTGLCDFTEMIPKNVIEKAIEFAKIIPDCDISNRLEVEEYDSLLSSDGKKFHFLVRSHQGQDYYLAVW